MKQRQLAPSQQVRPGSESFGARSADGSTSPTTASLLPYLPGLDGLRALAVLAVLVYHANYSWLPGGFLGVDVFFVLSGYLITVLLLVEWQRHQRIDLRAFWFRRARRLLPALFVLLPGTILIAGLAAPEALSGLRHDMLAALGYSTNWWLVIEEQSYFESMGRPSLLQHLWSLAVEEQFYLLWPVLFVGLMRVVPRGLPPILLAGAAGSALLMAALYDPAADPSRLYYGTDTRAFALLFGAALASVWRPGVSGRWWPALRLRADGSAERGRWSPILDLVGLVALAALGLSFFRLDEFHPLLYRGGFVFVAIVSALAVAVVANSRARVIPGVLGIAPLRWLGTRSYGVYLWHWPIFMVTRPHLDVPLDGLELFVLRVVATLAVSELSYRIVEMPVRRGALGRAWVSRPRRRVAGIESRQWAGVGFAAAAVLLALSAFVATESGRRASLSTGPEALQQAFASTFGTAIAEPWTGPASTELPPSLPPAELHPATTPPPEVPEAGEPIATARLLHEEAPRLPVLGAGEVSASVAATTPTAVSTRAPASGSTDSTESDYGERTGSASAPSVTAIGDSVMLGAVDQLAAAIPGIEIDGALGLQASAAIETLRSLRDAGRLGDAVVVHIGSNGLIRPSEFEAIMEIVEDVPQVVFLNVKVPRAWEERNNDLLASRVSRYSNAVLIDWHAASLDEADYFWNDGVHLRAEGAEVYASLIAAQITAR